LTDLNFMFLRIFLIFIFLFASAGLLGANPSLEDQVIPYTLKNGMKFLLVKRPGAPVFTGYLRVKVGGADESKGQSGIAHLLEHMAFKGTKTIGTQNYSQEEKILKEIEKIGVALSKLTQADQENSPQALRLKSKLEKLQQQADRYVTKEEFARIFTRNGATHFNATTSKDLTSYFVELPLSKLELWAYLESERLRDPVFREFYQERDVVLEERRSRVDNNPFGKNYEALLLGAFQNSPYQEPTIGHEKEVASLTATELKIFYQKYYVPQNMVGAVVGNINIDETKKILDRYFDRIPMGQMPASPHVELSSQKNEKRVWVSYSARPQLLMAYHKPTLPDREDDVFDLLGQILCEGRTSRFYQALVQKEKVAQTVSCDTSTPGARFDNLFMIYASALGDHTPSEIEKGIDQEIEKIKKNKISSEELERAKSQMMAAQLFHLQSNIGLAEALTYFESIAGDWHYLLQHEEVLKGITAEEIRKVAQKYLVKQNRTVSILEMGKVSP